MDKRTTSTNTVFYSQFGEDKRLWETHFTNQYSGICVEVGAGDGERYSNSLFFEQLGWKCLLLEANPKAAQECRSRRPSATVINAAVTDANSEQPITFHIADDIPDLSSLHIDQHNKNALVKYFGRVEVHSVQVFARTLDSLLVDWNHEPIDFITIDVEGHEYNVLRGFDIAYWKPRVVIVERNSSRPQWHITWYFLKAGYHLALTTGVNDWYTQPHDMPIRGMRYLAWLTNIFLLGRRDTY